MGLCKGYEFVIGLNAILRNENGFEEFDVQVVNRLPSRHQVILSEGRWQYSILGTGIFDLGRGAIRSLLESLEYSPTRQRRLLRSTRPGVLNPKPWQSKT